ncbi:MAG: D-alanyl-D-alanine carboxypeptidase [Candidatus Ryanbacteria bacterium]|nr:D-alanyl-D-alanine carboxypeptidase [Candidatus Ryanbacteria bacterium]
MGDFTGAVTVVASFLAVFGIIIPALAPPAEHLVPLPPPAHIVLDSTYTAQSMLVADLGGAWRTAEREPFARRPIASISKVMTGLLALEVLPLNTPIILSKEAIKTQGEVGDFQEGEVFALRDALYALMMPSSNDMAMAIAETVGERLGGDTFDEKIERFVVLMNKKADTLGMHNTAYRNPTGLDLDDGKPSNFSSANDLLKLIQFSMKTPLLWEPSREGGKIITSFGQVRHEIINSNALTPYIVNFVGSKTGTTERAGESIIIIYETILGRPQALIMLSAEPGQRIIEASSLLLKTGGMLP